MASKVKVDWPLVDAAVRVSVPMALEIEVFNAPHPRAAQVEDARQLRALAPVVDRKSALSARDLVRPIEALYGDRLVHLTSEAVEYASGQPRYAGQRMPPDSPSRANDRALASLHSWTMRQRVLGGGYRDQALLFVCMLDLDVHSIAELETALVATDYVLERGGSLDARRPTETLRRFQPILADLDAGGWKAPVGLDNKFRRPVWAALPGAEVAHPDWTTIMAWPGPAKEHWRTALLDGLERQLVKEK